MNKMWALLVIFPFACGAVSDEAVTPLEKELTTDDVWEDLLAEEPQSEEEREGVVQEEALFPPEEESFFHDEDWEEIDPSEKGGVFVEEPPLPVVSAVEVPESSAGGRAENFFDIPAYEPPHVTSSESFSEGSEPVLFVKRGGKSRLSIVKLCQGLAV